jgi:multicomponent Na+:H+ antiporter subunit D
MVEIPGGDPQPIAAVLVSTVATMLIIASYRRPNVREFWSVLAALLKFAIVASMLPAVLDGETFRWSMGEFVFGIEFALRVDTLGMVFALLASFLWIFTAFYCAGYMRGLNEPNQTRFFAAFAASLSTAIGIAFAENLIVMFLFYELLSIVTYPLVAHDETDEARAAGRKYLAYTFFGGGFLVLGGTALVYWLTGLADPTQVQGVAAGESTATVTFGEIGEPLMAVYQGSVVSEPVVMLAFGMLALGFGTKAAIMPLHSWLPDAMVAPTPVSGLLHAVAVVKSGAFGVSRVVLDVYGPDLTAALDMHIALGGLAAISFLLASFIALRKDHLKRRLAYSTASQLSYIIMGVALLSPAGITGGLLHIPAHAFMKLTLFFCAGAIHVETHTDYISNMAGIGKRMPLTMTAFTVAAAGMAGIPFVAGFVSKFYMLIGAVGMTDASYAYEPTAAGAIFALALIVSGVMNIAYFWPVVYTAFFQGEDEYDAKPLVEFPIGGKTFERGGEDVAADGGHEKASAEGHDEYHVSEEAHEEADHDHHHGGPPAGGWDRRSPREESTWLILMPITVVVTGAVVLGVIPGQVGFLDLVTAVAERATGLEVSL